MSKNDIINSMLKSRVTLMSPSPFIALYDKDDNLIQRYEYTDGRVPTSMTYNSTKYYLHYDQVGSLRAVSDTSGNIVKEITYDTYGNILSDTNEAFKVPFGLVLGQSPARLSSLRSSDAGGLYDTDTKLVRLVIEIMMLIQVNGLL